MNLSRVIISIIEIIVGICMLYLSHINSGRGTWGAFSAIVGLIIIGSAIKVLYDNIKN